LINRLLIAGIALAAIALLSSPYLAVERIGTGPESAAPSPSRELAQVPVASKPTQQDGGEGGVTVRATWVTEEYLKEKGKGDEADRYELDKNLVFYVRLDTHSVDLMDYDVIKNTVLRADGREISPNRWLSPSDSSHHRSGFLSFPRSSTTDDAKYLELVVRDLAGVSERVLRWDR